MLPAVHDHAYTHVLRVIINFQTPYFQGIYANCIHVDPIVLVLWLGAPKLHSSDIGLLRLKYQTACMQSSEHEHQFLISRNDNLQVYLWSTLVSRKTIYVSFADDQVPTKA